MAHRLRGSHSSSQSGASSEIAMHFAEQTQTQSDLTPSHTTTYDYVPVSADDMEGTKNKIDVTQTEGNDTEPLPKPSLYGARYYPLWTDMWAAESASLVLSPVALIYLICTLRYFHGSVIIEMPLKISINTLVAIIAAVVKSALLLPVAEGMLFAVQYGTDPPDCMDNRVTAISQLKWRWFTTLKPLADFETSDLASRGPCGTLLLLLRLRTRYEVQPL
jgi:hypothetical protein